jgi:uncharacterized protein YbjT (DUF2867 family)
MRILLTGANGYIGKRLMKLLLEHGHDVIATVRDKRRIDLSTLPAAGGRLEIIEADLLSEADCAGLPKNVDIAYYLVHSLTNDSSSFAGMEEKMATNFRHYADGSALQQIIYLSGIANDDGLSEHLSSRFKTEGILARSRVPLTVLRAAIIIGSGSASFEIIRDLVEKLPFMIAPKWLATKCQPIAVRSVLEYLYGVIGKEGAYGQSFDIGGPDILTYREMLTGYADVRGLKRSILSVPVMTPRLSSYWLYFVTSTSYTLAVNLVDSMKNEVICRDDRIDDIVRVEKISYKQGIRMALDVIQQDAVLSSWKDAVVSGKLDSHYSDSIRIPEKGCFKDFRSYPFDAAKREQVIENIWQIGGKNGWYAGNWLWELRGLMDQVVGGVGLRRGRKNQRSLSAGDALDFWRVLLADREKGRLLLFAEMKLPGEAWLELKIVPSDKAGELILYQHATFRPKGLLGRAYWYSVLPLHEIVFKGMARGILTRKSLPVPEHPA